MTTLRQLLLLALPLSFFPVIAVAQQDSLVIERLSGRVDLPISVDTRHAGVAEAALAAGATMVNDVWGFLQDPKLADVVSRCGAWAVAMHNRKAIAASAPPQRAGEHSSHGTTYGLVYLANGLGFALGPLAGGLIAATLGLRNVFFVTAAILLLIGAYLPFGIKDRPRSAR